MLRSFIIQTRSHTRQIKRRKSASPKRPKGVIQVGLSGFDYDEWKGLFYPLKIKKNQRLSFYNEHFSCVEINNSYYRLPVEKSLKSWFEITPENFMFCFKMSRLVCVTLNLEKKLTYLENFMKVVLSAMPRKLGPFLFQLRDTAKWDAKSQKVWLPFFKELRKRYPSQRFVLEARHESWMNDEALSVLRSHDIGWCVTDSGGKWPSLKAKTTDEVYIRFHGSDPKKLYSSLYGSASMQEWANIIQQHQREGTEVWAFFNNTAQGFALQDAQDLQRMVAQPPNEILFMGPERRIN